jgi:hypothetical protein
VESVVADIRQMYDNCTSYNAPGTAVAIEAERQRREFLKFCKKSGM